MIVFYWSYALNLLCGDAVGISQLVGITVCPTDVHVSAVAFGDSYYHCGVVSNNWFSLMVASRAVLCSMYQGLGLRHVLTPCLVPSLVSAIKLLVSLALYMLPAKLCHTFRGIFICTELNLQIWAAIHLRGKTEWRNFGWQNFHASSAGQILSFAKVALKSGHLAVYLPAVEWSWVRVLFGSCASSIPSHMHIMSCVDTRSYIYTKSCLDTKPCVDTKSPITNASPSFASPLSLAPVIFMVYFGLLFLVGITIVFRRVGSPGLWEMSYPCTGF